MTRTPLFRLTKLANAIEASGAQTKRPPLDAPVLAVVRNDEHYHVVTTVQWHRNPDRNAGPERAGGWWADELGGLCDDQIVAWLPAHDATTGEAV